MLPKAKQLHITRLNGSHSPYRNSEYIPLFYIFPKEMLETAGKEFLKIPRNPYPLFYDRELISFVESDLFLNFIIDATAYIVWPFMGLGAAREIYSGYEPSWRFAHASQYWLEGFIDEGIILSVDKLYQHCQKEPSVAFPYYSFDMLEPYINHTVKTVMAKYDMYEIIDVAKEYRCFEDFDYRTSNQKIDFIRSWYHTRTKHPMTSLDAHIEDYAENNNGMQWDVIDEAFDLEESVISEVDVAAFMKTLSEKDKQILELRMKGMTYEEIAKEVGYKNHSGVIKRITKIGEAYQKFADVDFGFGEEN